MLTHAKQLTWPKMILLTLVVAVSGCSNVGVNTVALCDGTETLRNAHVSALLVDGGPQSTETGASLVAAIDAGCIL